MRNIGNMAPALLPRSEATEYSNKHSTSITEGGYDDGNNILGETYKSNVSGVKKFSGRKFDAYTKLAGEGARFMCVRNNMGRLTNDTMFYAPGQVKGVKFCELWKTWSNTFDKQYSISDRTIINKLTATSITTKGWTISKPINQLLINDPSNRIRILTQATTVNPKNSIQLNPSS